MTYWSILWTTSTGLFLKVSDTSVKEIAKLLAKRQFSNPATNPKIVGGGSPNGTNFYWQSLPVTVV